MYRDPSDRLTRRARYAFAEACAKRSEARAQERSDKARHTLDRRANAARRAYLGALRLADLSEA